MPKSEWIHPAHFRRCEGKRSFRSLAKAEIEAARASSKTGQLILTYPCFDCGWVHVGHAELSQRLARLPHLFRPCQQCGGVIPESKKQKAKQFQAVALYCSDRCQKETAKQRRAQRIVASSSSQKTKKPCE
jgi:hypothetical protein